MEKFLIGLFIVLLGIAALAGVATVRYRGEIRTIQEHIDSLGSQVVKTNCGPIEYAQIGEGYPVLVVHGNAGGFDQGLTLAQGYLDQGFQVIAPSRFGYLRSSLPLEATPALQADAFVCLLDALGIDQVAVLTTSAGVTSSVQFALRHPDRISALILHSPNAPGKVEFATPPKSVFSALIHNDFAYWVLNTYLQSSMQFLVGVPKSFILTPEFQSQVKETMTSVFPVSKRADGMIFDTYVSNPEINHYPLPEIKSPTLVISALDDPMALHENARTMAEQIPNARLLVVPDGGHLLLGHTIEVRAEITQFLHDNVLELKKGQ